MPINADRLAAIDVHVHLEHPGDSEVFLHLGDRQVLRLPPAWTVDVGPSLLADLRVLLGPTAIIA